MDKKAFVILCIYIDFMFSEFKIKMTLLGDKNSGMFSPSPSSFCMYNFIANINYYVLLFFHFSVAWKKMLKVTLG